MNASTAFKIAVPIGTERNDMLQSIRVFGHSGAPSGDEVSCPSSWGLHALPNLPRPIIYRAGCPKYLVVYFKTDLNVLSMLLIPSLVFQ